MFYCHLTDHQIHILNKLNQGWEVYQNSMATFFVKIGTLQGGNEVIPYQVYSLEEDGYIKIERDDPTQKIKTWRITPEGEQTLRLCRQDRADAAFVANYW